MSKINLKAIKCDPNGCGALFTIPKEYNDIYNEFAEYNIPYKEAIVKENEKYIVVYCPDCNKEVMRGKWY